MESRVNSFAASILRFARRQVTKVTLDVSKNIFRSIAHEGAKLYVRTTLTKEAVPPDASDAAFDHAGVLVFGEKRF